MLRLFRVGCALAVLASSSVASAQFADCLSSRNAGFNTTTFFVSAVFNTIGCNASSDEVAAAQQTLEDVISAQQLNTSISNELKVCFYDGLYEGYISTLLQEYRECRSVPSAATLGRSAASVFRALFATLGDFVGPAVVEEVFSSSVRLRTDEAQLACQAAFLENVSAAFPEDPTAESASTATAAVVCGDPD